MGIGFVLILYAIVFGIAALVGAVVLGSVIGRLVSRSNPRREMAVSVGRLFPFACVAYAGLWFISYALINYQCFHRDPGLGDSWESPLPNGYALLMIDVTDEGTVYNPNTQPLRSGAVGTADSEFGVRQLQIAGDLIFGARDSGYFGRIDSDSNVVDRYFELDTRNGTCTEYQSLADLRTRAAREGVRLQLRPFDTVFDQYRWTWFDFAAAAALVIVPIVCFLLLVRWVWRIRRESVAATSVG
ncbi:MAG: hypothetical protein WA294_14780 [Acidobacteriaceae bacterium]